MATHLFRALTVLLLLTGWQTAFAQSPTGTVTLEISSKDAVVRIDGRVITVADQPRIELAAGTYKIESWAPFFAVHEDEVTVVAGQNTRYRKGLVAKSADYQPYLDAKSDYATKKLKRTIPDVTFGAVYAGVGYLLLGRHVGEVKDLHERAQSVREIYEASIHTEGIIQADADYAALTAEYEKAKEDRKKRLTIGIPAMAVATGALVYHLIRRGRSRPERPVYSPVNPFTTTGYSPQFRLTGSGNTLGLALNF